MLKSLYRAAYVAITLGFLRDIRRKLVPQYPHRVTDWVIYVQDNGCERNRLSLAYVDDLDVGDLFMLDELLPGDIQANTCQARCMPPTPRSPDNPFTTWYTEQLNKAIRRYAEKVPGIYPIC